MKIYQATIQQLDQVAFLFNQYRIFYRQPADLKSAQKFIRERLQQKDAVILLAMENEQPVGYTQLFPSWSSVSMQRVWILNDLFVLREKRNQGIAKALMNKAKDHAMSTNAVRIILATEVTNQIGQNLYESMGYRHFDDFYHYILSLDS
ncbi:GNAT family N-acetyltransferase [Pleurocapsa sp. CCALA 161]|uniref:GNAT family N-acetyltransferase n=1 Tax=Pleurocapsa sp. CCALA 161 TaxID=2107688 RepID=UPI000D04E766|nr:GNAT family N-acetyltransferase [Pleurocapsa sp. CCALA 161]PSB09926.1 GNAT family N-acetyltransferase [Pleurocapsa sp. CCALA 161]